jgi:hypothetical protein
LSRNRIGKTVNHCWSARAVVKAIRCLLENFGTFIWYGFERPRVPTDTLPHRCFWLRAAAGVFSFQTRGIETVGPRYRPDQLPQTPHTVRADPSGTIHPDWCPNFLVMFVTTALGPPRGVAPVAGRSEWCRPTTETTATIFEAALFACSTFTAQTGFFHRRYPPPGSFPDLHLNLQKTLAALTTKSSAFFCRGGRPKRSAPAFPRRAASLAHSLLQRRLTAFIGKLVRSDGHLGSDLTRRHRLSA